MTDQNDEIIDSEIQNHAKLFSAKSIYIASFIGTPIIGGILCAVNFKRLQNAKMAFRSILLGCMVALAVLVTFLNLPLNILDSIPTPVISGFYALLAYFYVQQTMQKDLIKHKEEGGSFYPEWIVAIVGVALVLVFVALAFLLA